jgi:hypothetical protein
MLENKARSAHQCTDFAARFSSPCNLYREKYSVLSDGLGTFILVTRASTKSGLNNELGNSN